MMIVEQHAKKGTTRSVRAERVSAHATAVRSVDCLTPRSVTRSTKSGLTLQWILLVRLKCARGHASCMTDPRTPSLPPATGSAAAYSQNQPWSQAANMADQKQLPQPQLGATMQHPAMAMPMGVGGMAMPYATAPGEYAAMMMAAAQQQQQQQQLFLMRAMMLQQQQQQQQQQQHMLQEQQRMQQARALGAAGFPTAAPAPVPGRANPTEAAGEAPSPAPAGFVARAPTATMASAPLAAHRQYAAAMGSVAPAAGAVAGGAHVATASGGASAPASMAAASMVAAPQSLPTAAMSAPGGFASPSAVRGLPRPPVSDEAFRSTINKVRCASPSV